MGETKLYIIFAVVSGGLLPLFHIFFSRLLDSRSGFDRALACGIIFYCLSWIIGMVAYSYLIRPLEINLNDIISGISMVGSIVLSYVEFASLIDRGFSLRLIVEIYVGKGKYTVEELMSIYSDGKGIGWMFSKRLNSMQKLKVISVDGDIISIRPLGVIIGNSTLIFKKLFKIGKGG